MHIVHERIDDFQMHVAKQKDDDIYLLKYSQLW